MIGVLLRAEIAAGGEIDEEPAAVFEVRGIDLER